MDEREPNGAGRTRTRVFLALFFGVALVLALMTIWATWTANA